jgi:hypothetical protein
MPDDYVTRAEFKSLVDTLDRWRVSVQSKQDKHHGTLYGNGVQGMDDMVRELWEDLQDRKKADKDAAKEAKNADKQTVLQKIKSSSEIKIVFINGSFTLAAIVVTWLVSRGGVP